MITVPQDLSDTRSVLEYLYKVTDQMQDYEMKNICMELLSEYEKTFDEPDESDKKNLPYNRKDAYSILEYLKLQAESLSEGRWTDFSDSDIGTVFLKLISYLADMMNFQIDKTTSELYLDTALERSSSIALAALVGYEPRHYLAAHCNVILKSSGNIPNGTIVPAYTVFTNSNADIQYCNLDEQVYYNNTSTFEVYEGSPINKSYTISDVDTLGRIILNNYNIATNTMRLYIDGIQYKQVDDVRFAVGELVFSVHISEDKYLYLQLPSYWPDVLTQGSQIKLSYLVTNGSDGRIGRNILTQILNNSSDYARNMTIASNTPSQGGYDPESVDEMKDSVPLWARTMNTIVTIKDFEEVSKNIVGISDIKALDYNDPISGLIQPDDYYKVYLYVLPEATQYDATDSDLIKYRNTIVKDRSDWTYADMNNVAKESESFAASSISGNTITLSGMAAVYGTSYDYTESDLYRALTFANNPSSTPTAEELAKYDLNHDGHITQSDALMISDIIVNGNYLASAVDNIILGVEPSATTDTYNYLPEYVSTTPGSTTTLKYTITVSGVDAIITLSTNWRDLTNTTDKFVVFYKAEQVLTDVGQELRNYIDERRLASLNVTFHDLEIVQPTINVDIYMDKNDIRFNTIGTQVHDFIIERFSRKYMKIGEPLFGSVIGAEILANYPYIRYCEVRDPEEKIEVVPKGFIDVVPNVMSNGTLVSKVNVNVYDYQNRTI